MAWLMSGLFGFFEELLELPRCVMPRENRLAS